MFGKTKKAETLAKIRKKKKCMFTMVIQKSFLSVMIV